MLNNNAEFWLFTVCETNLASCRQLSDILETGKKKRLGVRVTVVIIIFFKKCTKSKHIPFFYDTFAEIARSKMFMKHD